MQVINITHAHTHRHTHTHTGTHADRQTDRQTDRHSLSDHGLHLLGSLECSAESREAPSLLPELSSLARRVRETSAGLSRPLP